MTSNLWIKTVDRMPISGRRVPFVYKAEDENTYLAFGFWTRTFSNRGNPNPIYWVDETETLDAVHTFKKEDVIYWMEIPDWE